MEADLPARSDDADGEVSFDFDEDTPGVVWYSPWRRDEDEEDEETDEVEAEEGEGVAEGDTFCVVRPVSPDTLSDDDSEEEDVAEETEDIVPIPVSDPAVMSDDEDTCPTPPSVQPSHRSEDVVIDRAPIPSLKSRLRRQKRARSDDDGSDYDGDDSGDYGQPIRRPRKKTRGTLSPPHLDRQTASPVPEPEIPSTSDAPGRHNEGGMTAYRLCGGLTELACGVPGCKEILRESELKNARKHYRDHFKGTAKGTPVTCNWSGCTEPFTFDSMQSQRHLREDHCGMLYECPKCKKRVVRGTQLKKHIAKCRGPRGVRKKATKGAGKSGGGRGRRRK
ncbi:hypothetical protein LXA43DRAFT_980334 [Ganoderma leucocontextum]|nr:hypothetical protein LXA43DRAFT_980334 [Ganoderma leucocontextum]